MTQDSPLETLIHRAEDIPLSDRDIMSITGGRVVVRVYEELSHMRSIEQALGMHGAMVLLYTFKDTQIGHWVACWLYKGVLYHYDSLGLEPDAEMDGHTTYSTLLAQSPYPIEINRHQHQLVKEHVNTCGRHAALRVLFGAMNHDSYHKMITAPLQLRHTDDITTALTITHALGRMV